MPTSDAFSDSVYLHYIAYERTLKCSALELRFAVTSWCVRARMRQTRCERVRASASASVFVTNAISCKWRENADCMTSFMITELSLPLLLWLFNFPICSSSVSLRCVCARVAQMHRKYCKFSKWAFLLPVRCIRCISKYIHPPHECLWCHKVLLLLLITITMMVAISTVQLSPWSSDAHLWLNNLLWAILVVISQFPYCWAM